MKSLLFIILSMIFMLSSLCAEQIVVNHNENNVQLVISDDSQSILHFSLGSFNRYPVTINNQLYYQLQLKNEAVTYEAGYPEIPTVSRSIIIPGTAKMNLELISNEYIEYPMSVIPSKGALKRNVDPSQVPYIFSDVYNMNSFYPTANVSITEPFIIRDFRGITVSFKPFAFNPQTGNLRVYTDIRIRLVNTGLDTINILTNANNRYSSDFGTIYDKQFMNFNPTKYTPVDEIGKLLVICPTSYLEAIQPYVDWKRQKGITTDLVELSTIGNSSTAVQQYIRTRYSEDNDLTFVQLIGDSSQMPTLSYYGGGADPAYSLIVGDDSYPDIFIGRFSAETVAQLQTQVSRTIYYERDMPITATWLNKAIGIASIYGGGSDGDLGESDQAHMENIRTNLTSYNYHTNPIPGTSTVDQAYEANGASSTQISSALNQGRGWIDYVGHGASTYWVTTGFSNSHIDALTNENMLPVIVSVACVNGNFTNQTCFAEAWLRATHNNNPTGAIAVYMSSINQSWNSPMRGQDEIIDLLRQNLKTSVGGLFYNGSCKMIEVYGTDGSDMFKTWHIFGDASLQVRSNVPTSLTITHDPALLFGANTFTVNTGVAGALVSLTKNGTIYGAAYSDATGQTILNLANLPQQPQELTLTVTAFDKVTNVSSVPMISGNGPVIVVSNSIVSDGDNQQADSGESFFWDLALFNQGMAAANSITVIASTEDPYVTILNNTVTITSISPQQSIITRNGIHIQVANNIPDQHEAQFHVLITASDNHSWNYELNLILNAPVFQFDELQFNDSQGNHNGRIDAGESVIITIPFTNTGHTDAATTVVSLNEQIPNFIVQEMNNTFTNVAINTSGSATFQVTFSSQILAGTHQQIHCTASSGSQSNEYNYDVIVGMVREDFESGTLTAFPWIFDGGIWTLTTADPYSDIYCIQSPVIGHNASTSMQVSVTTVEDGTISFYCKTSSELNYDYLQFFINNIQQEQWSGETAWMQHSFNVSAGQNTFKWRYVKDVGLTGGSDCAWLDNIVFPIIGGTAGTPALVLSSVDLFFGNVAISDHAIRPITITNNGDVVMIGTITGNNEFTIAPTGTDGEAQLSYHIQAGQSATYDIIFTPAEILTYNQQITITSDDPAHQTNIINVMGQGSLVGNDDSHALPTITSLLGNYPNPFNPSTTISFSLKEKTKVKLEVYNVLGQKVRTLVEKDLPAGMNQVNWNGVDNSGRSVSSGVYFMRMEAGRYSSTKKMIMIK